MTGITLDTKLRDIYALPQMRPYARYMLYTPGEDPENSWHAPYTVQGLEKIGWSQRHAYLRAAETVLFHFLRQADESWRVGGVRQAQRLHRHV